MEYLRTLNGISRGEEHIAGERAVDLALLSKKNFNVPLSFVLINNAFEDFIIANKLQFKIAKILNTNKSLGSKYNSIREEMLKGKFPELMIRELHEAFESLVIEKNANVKDLLKDDDKPFVTLVISPNYALNPESKEGIIINVHDFEDLLEAVKECWACLFTANMQAYRKKIGLLEKNLNCGIIIHNMRTCETSIEAYSAMVEDNEKIKVQAYLGFPDLSNNIERDEFRLNREFLKIEYQGITVQTHRLTRGLDNKLDRVAVGIMGEEQKLNDKEVMEVARLAKKASNILGSHVKLTGYVKDNEIMIYVCDKLNLDSSNLDVQQINEIINEEIINEEVNEKIEEEDEEKKEGYEEKEHEYKEKEEFNEESEEDEFEELEIPIPEDDEEQELDKEQECEEQEYKDDEKVINSDEVSDWTKEEELGKTIVEEEIEEEREEEDDFIFTVNEEETEEENKEEDKKTEEKLEEKELEEGCGDYEKEDQPKIISEEEVEIEEYEEQPSNIQEEISEEDENIEYVIEEDEDDSFYDAFDKVKQALLNKYEERFRKIAPDKLIEVYLELNNEIIIPYEEEIGLLLRIFEQEEEYTDEQKEKIMSIIDDFLKKISE